MRQPGYHIWGRGTALKSRRRSLGFAKKIGPFGPADRENNQRTIEIMNNGIIETTQAAPHARPGASDDELSRAKRELLQAEVRLAKARATVAATEIDIKVLSLRLKSFAK